MASKEIERIVMELRPIDDTYMNIIFSNNIPLVEYVLRIILDKADLTIIESKTQEKTNFVGSRNVTFDVLAKDSSGELLNIEVQRGDSGAGAKRARYHSAALDVKSLPSGAKFSELIDSYVIFITENDVLKGNRATYRIERSVEGTNEKFNDGAHIIFVNASYNNTDSEIGKLMHDFLCSDSKEMLYEPLAEITYKYKNTPEGVGFMCKAEEEYGLMKEKEGIEKGVLRAVMKFIQKGKLSYEEIAETMEMPVEEIQRLAAQIS